MMNIRNEDVLNKLEELSTIMDTEGLRYDLDYELGQIIYFYKYVAPKTGKYHLSRNPKEHTVAYFNLTRGFPTEICGGHWCYVFKHIRGKALVVPLTSIKSDSLPVDPTFQLDIDVAGFERKSRMQLSDMRTVDFQRCYVKKGYKDVTTAREEISRKINQTLLESDEVI